AITNMQYTRVTYERWRYLASQHVVSDQDRDQTWEAYNAAKATVDAMRANVNVAKAAIAANEANVRQLMALQGFKRVYAPFAGIVSARNVEVGSLINAGRLERQLFDRRAPFWSDHPRERGRADEPREPFRRRRPLSNSADRHAAYLYQ